MSWVAASFLVLGAALIAGFAWYERAHPTARVIALVATLAALAALGRIAFAPLPNVKPTTDIVLISGYVLGGAPGFAVGAVAALASNLFFGQGPWTPWQMVAWGGVGLAGAGLARVAGRRLGRVPLAAACAVASLGFGAVMNLHLWVSYSGDHTAAKLAAIFATSLPFDLAHMVGSIAVLPRVRAGARQRPVALPHAVRDPLGAGRRHHAAARARHPGRRRTAAQPTPRPPPTRRRPRPRSATSSRRRTTTAAGEARPGRARRSSTPAGRRSASPPRAATRATSGRRARSPTCATAPPS